MPERTHYLICYDISNSDQRHRASQKLLAYAIGRQKSAYLCWLTAAENLNLQNEIQALIENGDALLWIHLNQRYVPQHLGTAQPWQYQDFMVM